MKILLTYSLYFHTHRHDESINRFPQINEKLFKNLTKYQISSLYEF